MFRAIGAWCTNVPVSYAPRVPGVVRKEYVLMSRVAWCQRRRASGVNGVGCERSSASKVLRVKHAFGVERVWCRMRLVHKGACVKHGRAFHSRQF